MRARDLLLARRARRAGARYSLRIIREARKAGMPLSLAFALVEQESNFRNVVGHDPGGPHPGAKVTRKVVADILAAPVSNGVGLTQLTYKPFIRQANALGRPWRQGAWTPRWQLAVAFKQLGNLIRAEGLRTGIQHYNGTGSAAVAYASSVLHRRDKWHRILQGK